MNGIFDLGLPAWQIVVRTVIVYVALLVLIRLSGKRTLGEMSIFDLIVVIVLGSAVRTSMIGNDKSLFGGLLAVAVLMLLDFAGAWLSSHSLRMDRVIEGRPVLLARDGVLFDEVLKRCNVPRSAFVSAMRKNGCTGIEMVEQAILEPGGSINVRKRSAPEPAAPKPAGAGG